MSQFNIAEAKAHFSELVNKAMRGEEVVIARDNKPLVRLAPVAPVPVTRKPGTARGKVLAISEDFDHELADFSGYR